MTLDKFVPLNIELAEKIGAVDALVAGAIWLKWNIKQEVCNAGTREIGRTIGLDHSTVSKAIKRLIKAGWVEDLTPTRKGAPHDIIPSVDLINTLCIDNSNDTNDTGVDLINTLEQGVDDITTLCEESVDLINTTGQSVDLINKEEESSSTTTGKSLKIINSETEAAEALTALTANYTDFINVSFSPTMADELKDYSWQVKPLWVANAFKAVEDAGAFNWNYPRAILDSCIKAGRWVDKSELKGHKNGQHKPATKKTSLTPEQQKKYETLQNAGKPDG